MSLIRVQNGSNTDSSDLNLQIDTSQVCKPFDVLASINVLNKIMLYLTPTVLTVTSSIENTKMFAYIRTFEGSAQCLQVDSSSCTCNN